jgi:hypothetical protein
MKRTLFLIVAIVFALVSCQKKKTKTTCYVCKRYQTIYSSYPVLAHASAFLASDTLCNMNDGLLNMYVSTHSYYDTLKNSHDTLTFADHYVVCDLE